MDIYFTAARMIDIPAEREILAMIKENTEKSAGFPLCSIREKGYDVIRFTGLHRILRKNFFMDDRKSTDLFQPYSRIAPTDSGAPSRSFSAHIPHKASGFAIRFHSPSS